jgi:ubiquinol-cytochrome c reductase cytochrome b subunit
MTNIHKENLWNQYLAGLIDADGSLLISKKGYVSLEITMGINDYQALNKIKQKLGGSIKLRSKARAFRYRLHHKIGIIELINRINGFICQTNRTIQLKKICNLYNIPFKPSAPLNHENAWFAGFFDGDGTLGFSMKKGFPQLIVSVSQKNSVDLIPFQQIFGGSICFDKAANIYKWDLSSKNHILNFCNYLKKYPLQSSKKKRISLIHRFFLLRQYKAFRKDIQSGLYKAWLRFEKEWNSI